MIAKNGKEVVSVYKNGKLLNSVWAGDKQVWPGLVATDFYAWSSYWDGSTEWPENIYEFYNKTTKHYYYYEKNDDDSNSQDVDLQYHVVPLDNFPETVEVPTHGWSVAYCDENYSIDVYENGEKSILIKRSRVNSSPYERYGRYIGAVMSPVFAIPSGVYDGASDYGNTFDLFSVTVLREGEEAEYIQMVQKYANWEIDPNKEYHIVGYGHSMMADNRPLVNVRVAIGIVAWVWTEKDILRSTDIIRRTTYWNTENCLDAGKIKGKLSVIENGDVAASTKRPKKLSIINGDSLYVPPGLIEGHEISEYTPCDIIGNCYYAQKCSAGFRTFGHFSPSRYLSQDPMRNILMPSILCKTRYGIIFVVFFPTYIRMYKLKSDIPGTVVSSIPNLQAYAEKKLWHDVALIPNLSASLDKYALLQSSMYVSYCDMAYIVPQSRGRFSLPKGYKTKDDTKLVQRGAWNHW